MFITFEGPEGSGKTSQARVLASTLGSYGEVVLLREPGGTPIGEQLRSLLLSPDTPPLDPITQLLILSAARAQLVREVIWPALDRRAIVLCVRYADSTRAYQGGGEGLPEEQIEAAIALATGGLEPDLTVYLDIDVKEGLMRRAGARDAGVVGASEGWNSFDARELEFHERVRQAYRQVARRYSHRVVVVNAAASFDAVAEQIRQAVLPRVVHPSR